jgi:hypothetical protein
VRRVVSTKNPGNPEVFRGSVFHCWKKPLPGRSSARAFDNRAGIAGDDVRRKPECRHSVPSVVAIRAADAAGVSAIELARR